MFHTGKKSALLIDFDNVIGMTGGDFAAKIANWLAWLEEGGFDPKRRRRNFLTKRVYWNGMNERYRAAFEAAGFEAFACRAIARDKKSSADIVMTLDAIEVATDYRDLREVILLTSDTDFVPVVNRLQDRNLEVAAMGNEENTTAAVFRDYADYLVLRKDLTAAFAFTATPRGWMARLGRRPALAEAPSTPLTAPKPSPAKPKPRDALDEAGDRLVHAAKGALGSPLSRQSVHRVLQAVDGFSPTGASPWLGCGSYKGLLRAIAKRRQDLRLHAYRNGGLALVYRAEDER